MDIKGKRILVLGGYGLVGQAVINRLMAEGPSHIVITSLKRDEAESAVKHFEAQHGNSHTTFEPFWGNLFVRDDWKDDPREEVLQDPKRRDVLIDDILGDLTEDVLNSNCLYNAVEWARPDAVIDCINTSTAIAYQDIFTLSLRVKAALKTATDSASMGHAHELVERLLASLYVPQLIRHVQILHRALIDFNVTAYIKVGTSGTGGMGLNIPFTHSEERPSRVLLSKSSVAGAHSLLLFLMARTPRAATIVKEIKPTATIAWKEVGYGPIRKGGKAIELHDVPVDRAEELGSTLKLIDPTIGTDTGDVLESVYIDTGENGIFSRGEFETISALGQMEMVTPEEIAENIARELLGAATGKDIVGALDASTMGPSYRAGYLRESAVRMMQALEEKTGVPSVAFEMLGPPRLAKLLFEAHLLKLMCGDFATVTSAKPDDLARRAQNIVSENQRLRSQMISIGIPVLLPDGKHLVRGRQIKIPPAKLGTETSLEDGRKDEFAREGWVDLRPENMALWQSRLTKVRDEVGALDGGTGSGPDRSSAYWDDFSSLNEGRLAAWIFTIEEGGERVKR
jgi:hypothetical protein